MTEPGHGPEELAQAIRDQVGAAGTVCAGHLLAVEAALAKFPHSALLLVLRGDLIQLGEGDPRWDLQDAEDSYLRAAKYEPTNPTPLDSLGYFYDRVMGHPAKAELFFRRAIELGAGESAHQGLRGVLRQLSESHHG